ncbi:MAG: response regulator [Bdellovibrionota bacterium]|jgi:CheY-like chemotaxis protein
MRTVLVIDDDIEFREILSLMLLEAGCAVWEASSTAEAFQILDQENSFDYIFCDLHLPFTLGKDAEEYEYSEEVGIRTLSELSTVYGDTVTLVALSAAEAIDRDLVRTRLGHKIPLLGKPIRSEVLEALVSSGEPQIPVSSAKLPWEDAFLM